MAESALNHEDCVKLLQSPERGRRVRVSIDGGPATPLACLVLSNGDLLLPGDRDRSFARRSIWRPVTVEFDYRDSHGRPAWTVTGRGLAQPLRSGDRPHPLPYTTVDLDDDTTFEDGIRVWIARLHAVRPDEPAVPRPRDRPSS
jgi:hypothetical protein